MKFISATPGLLNTVNISKRGRFILRPGWTIVLFATLVGGLLNAAPITTLKVMQFNIKNNAALGLSAVEQAIKNENPDVVTLNEADGYTIQPIASALGGFDWIQTGGVGQYGIISRYPIIKRIGETAQPYGGVGATLELSPNQRVHIFASHLNYTPYGPYQLVGGKTPSQVITSENSARMPGLNELLGLTAPMIGSAEPAFLTGDFNAPSDVDYNPYVGWPESIACRNAGLIDSYSTLNLTSKKYAGQFAFNDPGITWTPLTQYEPSNCFDRIDFIYYSTNDNIIPMSATEVDSRNNNVTPWPSDHRAVVTVFSLSMPPQQAQSSSPLPANAYMTAPLRPLLTWIPGTSTSSHNLYFGTVSPGVFISNLTDSKYGQGRLAPNTTYYWHVDEVKSGAIIAGNTWSFKTGNFSWADPNKTSYAKGENITVNFGNGPGNKTDWIALYAKGAAYGPGNVPSIKWAYLNGSQTAPKTALKNGSITFMGGLATARTYVVRFFSNNGFFVLDETTITIQ